MNGAYLTQTVLRSLQSQPSNPLSLPNEGQTNFPCNHSALVGAVWNEPAIDSSGDINTFCRSLERLMEERFGDRVTIKKGFEVRRLLLDEDRKRIAGVRCARAGAEGAEEAAVLDLEADKFILGSAEGGRRSQLKRRACDLS